jgi:hypothetical protein
VDTYLCSRRDRRLVDAGVPWQQLGDARDGVIGDAFEHVVEIDLRIEAVELG